MVLTAFPVNALLLSPMTVQKLVQVLIMDQQNADDKVRRSKVLHMEASDCEIFHREHSLLCNDLIFKFHELTTTFMR